MPKGTWPKWDWDLKLANLAAGGQRRVCRQVGTGGQEPLEEREKRRVPAGGGCAARIPGRDQVTGGPLLSDQPSQVTHCAAIPRQPCFSPDPSHLPLWVPAQGQGTRRKQCFRGWPVSRPPPPRRRLEPGPAPAPGSPVPALLRRGTGSVDERQEFLGASSPPGGPGS